MCHIFYMLNKNNFMFPVYSILSRLNKSIMYLIKCVTSIDVHPYFFVVLIVFFGWVFFGSNIFSKNNIIFSSTYGKFFLLCTLHRACKMKSAQVKWKVHNLGIHLKKSYILFLKTTMSMKIKIDLPVKKILNSFCIF